MKKIIFILLLFPSVVFSQKEYRIDLITRNTIKVKDYKEINKIDKIESILNENNAYLTGILMGDGFEDPTTYINEFKLPKLVCLKCYADEYKQQTIKLDSLIKSTKLPEDFIVNKNSDSLLMYVDIFLPSKRILVKTKDELSFEQNIQIELKGGNIDLGINPEEYYKLYRIGGSFLDVFPIWKKLFDNESKQEDVLKVVNYTERTVKTKALIYKNSYYRIALNNHGNGYWEIKIN